LSIFVYANSYRRRGFFTNSRARDILCEPEFRTLDTVQDGEQRIEVHGWEGPTRPVEALYDCMRSATGVEFDPRGRLSLHEFRWPTADHELGQDAQELPLQVIRLGYEDLYIGPELLESCGDHLPVYGRLVSYQGPHASRAGIVAPGGTSEPYGTWLCTPAPSPSIMRIVEMPRLWNFA
jgi:hypothetical protein